MKIILITLAVVLSHTVFGQKLSVNEIDKFTHQKRLETSKSTLKSSMVYGYISAYIRVVDSLIFINLKGADMAATVIGEGDKVIFLLDDGSTVTGYSPSIQDYNVVQTSIGASKIYDHQYRISEDDLKAFNEHRLISIRVYGANGYIDTDIPKKNQDEIQRLAQIIQKNL